MAISTISTTVDAINRSLPKPFQSLAERPVSSLATAFNSNSSNIDYLKTATINSRRDNQVVMRLFAIQTSNEALAITEITASALSKQISLAENIKTSAQEALKITQTDTSRTKLNQTVQSDIATFNQQALGTQFNGAKLLDGSFAGVYHFDDQVRSSTFSIILDDTQAPALGRFVLDSNGVGLSNQVVSSTEGVSASNQVAAQTLTLKSDALTGLEKDTGLSFKVATNLSAQGFASLINQTSAKTTVVASAQTSIDLQLAAVSSDTEIQFDLASGDGATLANYANVTQITATISDATDLTALKDQINAAATQTGINAEFTSDSDKDKLRLIHDQGANIQLSSFRSGLNGPQLSLIDTNNSDQITQLLGEGISGNDSVLVSGSVRLASNQAFSLRGDGSNQSIFANAGLNPAVFRSLEEADVSAIDKAGLALSSSEGALLSLNQLSNFVAELKVSISDQIDKLNQSDRQSEQQFGDSSLSLQIASVTKAQVSRNISSAVLAQAKNIPPTALQLLE